MFLFRSNSTPHSLDSMSDLKAIFIVVFTWISYLISCVSAKFLFCFTWSTTVIYLCCMATTISSPNFESVFRRCSDEEDGDCTWQHLHRHCILCYQICPTPAKCERHFRTAHLSRAVQVDGELCFPCKLDHEKANANSRAHYHCPTCQKTLSDAKTFSKHVERHKQTPKDENNSTSTKEEVTMEEEDPDDLNDKEAMSSTDEVQGGDDNPFNSGEDNPVNSGEDNPVNNGEDNPVNSGEDNPVNKEDCNIPENRATIVKCTLCGEPMRKDSLSRHARLKHGTELVQNATCLNEKKSLFLVRTSAHGGVGYPLHVLKVTQEAKESRCVECEDDGCMDSLKVAWRSGLLGAECRHSKEVSEHPIFPQPITDILML